jgi:hypothetical protein
MKRSLRGRTLLRSNHQAPTLTPVSLPPFLTSFLLMIARIYRSCERVHHFSRRAAGPGATPSSVRELSRVRPCASLRLRCERIANSLAPEDPEIAVCPSYVYI